MEKSVYPKIFMWMFIGLLITFGTGYFVATSEEMLTAVFSSGIYFILIIAELATVIFLSARIQKMSVTTARLSFILYSFLTGLTFSSIFVVYKLSSILFVFLIAAVVFLFFAIVGAVTKIDLSKLGTILLMMLVGIILCSLLNAFIGSENFDIALCIISLIIFFGFIAYDMQKIRRLSEQFDEDKLAIIGALELYLDFINIFVDLLRIFGNSRD